MAKWRSLVDDRIREAEERGDFDDLPGRGKPLVWDSEGGDSEWWLANHMLKNAGVLPAWLDGDKELRAERQALEAMLADFAAWHRAERAAAEARPAGERAGRLRELEEARERTEALYRQRAARYNERVDRHNMAVPLPSMHKFRLRVDDALARFRDELGSGSTGGQ
jgi:hypothetical protein